MSDKFNQLIELLIAEDEEKAQELFHEIVVERSRSIYENLIDEETVDEEEEVAEDETVEESDFDEELGGDAADDMIDDIEADEQGLAVEDDDSDEEIEDRVVDLEDALDELKAEFEKIMGGDEEEGPEMDMDDEMDMDMEMGDEEADEEEEEMESVEETEEVVREYSEKVNAKNVEEGDGASGPVAGKNDMGGNAVDPTGEESGGAAPKATVQTDAADPKGATMSKA